MDFEKLQNFVNEYLVKTEPNLYWKNIEGQTIVTKTVDDTSEKIILKNKINDEKEFIGNLGLNKFNITINKPGDSIILAEGEYESSDEIFKNACIDLDRIMNENIEIDEVYDMELDKNIQSRKYKYFNFPTEFLVSVNNNGNGYHIYPLWTGGADLTNLDENMKNIIDKLKIIINFFAEKHMIFSGLSFNDQKNFIYVYKITSPYTQGATSLSSKGMQTEYAHMDTCQIGNDQLIKQNYCEISSIVYLDVKNNCSPLQDYYASAAFFYGPEIPLPIEGHNDLSIDLTGVDSNPDYHRDLLQKFQANYKRLFVSVPMKNSGWAIWANSPKRTIKNRNPINYISH